MSREAMQRALDALCDFDYDKRMEAIAALRAALAADQLTAESERLGLYVEPVAWLFVLDGCRQVMLDEDADEAIRHHGIPLFEAKARGVE